MNSIACFVAFWPLFISFVAINPVSGAKTTAASSVSAVTTTTATATASQPPSSLLPPLISWTVDGSTCDLRPHSIHIPSESLPAGPAALEIDYDDFPFVTPITWDEELPPTNCTVVVRYGFGSTDSAGWSVALTAAELSGQTDLKNGSWVPWMNVSTEWSPDDGKSWIEPGKGAIVGFQGSSSFPNGTFDKETRLDLTIWSPCGVTGDLLLRVNVTGRLIRSGNDTVPDSKDELSVPGTLKNRLTAEWMSNACETLNATVPFH